MEVKVQSAKNSETNRDHVLTLYVECGKSKRVKNEPLALMFLPHSDVFCDLLLNRPTATCNLFVSHNKEVKKVDSDVIYASVLQYIMATN